MSEKKKHLATDQKKEQGRKDGKTLKSQVLTQTAVIFASFSFLLISLRLFWVRLLILLHYSWTQGLTQPLKLTQIWLYAGLGFIISILLWVGFVGFLAEYLQVGWKLHFSIIAPKLSRLDFTNGFKGMFGKLKTIWEPALKLLLGSFVLWLCLKQMLLNLFTDLVLERSILIYRGFNSLLIVLMVMLALLIAVAVLDYFLRKRQYERELSMSDDELRREIKDQDGDPFVKSVRRSMHEALLIENLEQRIKKAKVVIVKKAS